MLRGALRAVPRQIVAGPRNARGLTNFYDIFPKTFPKGKPPGGPFAVDARALRQEYLKLQQSAHPDVAGAEAAAHDAATLSTAYRALSDPLLRAQHVLSLNGVDPLSEAKTLQNEDLLMELMMIREEAAEADTDEERAQMTKANEERIASRVAAIDAALVKGDLETAHNATIELSYWVKLRGTLRGDDNQ